MDFRHTYRADAQKLNVILWKDAMGDRPAPVMLLQRAKKTKKDRAKKTKKDDDD
jgi:hypothetical protein